MSQTDHILIVEDEEKLASLLSDYFSASQYQNTQLHHGDEVIPWLKENSASIILLDIMLPGQNGVDLCKQIRLFSDVPIVMTTAKVDEIDRLIGLEVGADDYICKPYSPREVVARAKAILRRRNNQLVATTALEPANSGSQSLILDKDRYQAKFGDEYCELTAIEFHLLEKLYAEPGRIFNREQLMDNMYDDNRVVSYRTIDSHIKKLRKKLNDMCPEQSLIASVYGVGYKLNAE